MRDEIIRLNWIKNIKKNENSAFLFRSDDWIADRNSIIPIYFFFLQKGPYKNQNFAIKPLKTKSNFKNMQSSPL